MEVGKLRGDEEDVQQTIALRAYKKVSGDSMNVRADDSPPPRSARSQQTPRSTP